MGFQWPAFSPFLLHKMEEENNVVVFFKKKYTLVAEAKLVVLKIYVGIFYQISE